MYKYIYIIYLYTLGIFAIKSYYYKEIGKFDTSLKYWGQETLELSLRVWMCGGSVIRQPCSRVAHKYNNIYESKQVGNGIHQRYLIYLSNIAIYYRYLIYLSHISIYLSIFLYSDVDYNVKSVAEHWMTNPLHKETVYRARFTGRVPYKVLLSIDTRQPKKFSNVKTIGTL